MALLGTPASAQIVPGPPGPYVVDLRVVSGSVPGDAAFVPGAAATAPAPSRALGLDAGAHVYAGRLGVARLGVGASVLRVRATAATLEGSLEPERAVEVRSLAPQVSLNFGSRDGWSYLSAGAGVSQVIGTVADDGPDGRASRAVLTMNGGGGARWFLTDRLGVGFDVRLYRLSATATTPAARLFAASVGLSLR